MQKKIKLSFVNKGKEFNIPKMTVLRQEELMEEMIKTKIDEKTEPLKYNREFNKIMVWKTLQVIDVDVSLDDINNMHPNDFIKIFTLIWESGRELKDDSKVDDKKFRAEEEST